MKVTYQCPACGGDVEYEKQPVQATPLRMYGVPTYVCTAPCSTCESFAAEGG